MKKLPNMYKGMVRSNRNQKEALVNDYEEEKHEDINVNKKINDIFSSPSYVYKADVQITTTSGEIIKKTIIGKTNNSLITMDDELIDVSNISQIEFLN